MGNYLFLHLGIVQVELIQNPGEILSPAGGCGFQHTKKDTQGFDFLLSHNTPDPT
jgi:hypothetical protein